MPPESPWPPADRARGLDLLLAEYMKLQDIVETFDERTLQIKGWSVTISLAAVVAAFASDKLGDNARTAILLVAAASALAFWAIEFVWKCFQWTFFHRIDHIEQSLRDGGPLCAPLQIRSFFHANFKRDLKGNYRKAWKPFIALPHAGVAIAALALAAASAAGMFTAPPAAAPAKLIAPAALGGGAALP